MLHCFRVFELQMFSSPVDLFSRCIDMPLGNHGIMPSFLFKDTKYHAHLKQRELGFRHANLELVDNFI